MASELWGQGVHCTPKFRTCIPCTPTYENVPTRLSVNHQQKAAKLYSRANLRKQCKIETILLLQITGTTSDSPIEQQQFQ